MAKILKSRTCTVQLSDNSWISLEEKEFDWWVQLWPLCSMNFLMVLKCWLCSCHLELENALALKRQAREVAFFRATSIYNLLHILVMLSPVWMFLFFLNSCISVIEQFWRELSQATYFPSKGLFAEVLFSSCLYNDADDGWDGGKWLLVPAFPQFVQFIRETTEGRVSLCLLTKTATGGSGELKEGPEQENFSKSEKHGDNEAADSGLVSKPSLIV